MKFTRSQAVTSVVHIHILAWLEGKNKWETNVNCKRARTDVERKSVSVVFSIIIVIYYLSHVTHFVEEISLSNEFWGSWCNNWVDITFVKIFIHVFKPTRFPSHGHVKLTLLPRSTPIVLTLFIISQKCCLSTDDLNICHVCRRNVDCWTN